MSAVVGVVLYSVAGGVEAGYMGNPKLGDAGGLLFVAGVLAFVLGVAGLLVTAVAGAASTRMRKHRRRD